MIKNWIKSTRENLLPDRVAQEKLKDLYQEHKPKIGPAIGFIRNCANSVATMRENVNIIDYVDLGFNIRSSYLDYYGRTNPRNDFIENKDWEFYFTESFFEYIVELITKYSGANVQLIKTLDPHQSFIATINSVHFGWVKTENNITNFWIKTKQKEKAHQLLNKIFWEQFNNKRIVITNENNKLSIKEDLNHDNFVISKNGIDISEYIKKFKSNNISRSILFYGPPGSGKTNIVKGIASYLNLKSIRFENLNMIHSNFLTEIIQLINPDCIILEDIDHLTKSEVDTLLDKVESFNNQGQLVFATANEVSKLNNALIRPGRFDETREIKTLDEEIVLKLVENDLELFELVKEFPVAFTIELMKRVKVLGKKEALLSIEDLLIRIDNFNNTNYGLKNEDNDGPYIPKFKIGGVKQKSVSTLSACAPEERGRIR